MTKIYSLGKVSGLLKSQIDLKEIGQIECEKGDFELVSDVKEGYSILLLNLLSGDNIKDTKKITDCINLSSNNCKLISHSINLIDIFTDKFKTKKFLEKKGFNVTKGIKLDNLNFDIKLINKINNIGFPLVLKELNNLGGLGIYGINTIEELINFNFDESKEYLIEEYIEGIEYSGNLFNHKLNTGNFYGGNNITILPPIEKGLTGIENNGDLKHSLSKLRTSHINNHFIEVQIREICEEIGQIEGIEGFLEVEFILDKKTNQLKIIEINPRISGTFNLSINSGGYSINDIIKNLKNNPSYSNNILEKKILIELPIQHKYSNFISTNIKLFNGKIINKKEYREFEPYLELFVLEFESEKDYKAFINNLKENE